MDREALLSINRVAIVSAEVPPAVNLIWPPEGRNRQSGHMECRERDCTLIEEVLSLPFSIVEIPLGALLEGTAPDPSVPRQGPSGTPDNLAMFIPDIDLQREMAEQFFHDLVQQTSLNVILVEGSGPSIRRDDRPDYGSIRRLFGVDTVVELTLLSLWLRPKEVDIHAPVGVHMSVRARVIRADSNQTLFDEHLHYDPVSGSPGLPLAPTHPFDELRKERGKLFREEPNKAFQILSTALVENFRKED